MLLRPDFPFRPASLPFFYGWLVLAVSTLGIVMSMPGQTMGVSLFTDHLIDALALSRLEISNAYLVGTLSSALLLPFAGSVLDRRGARSLVLIACGGLAVTLVALSQVDTVAGELGDWAPGIPHAWIAAGTLAVGFTGVRFFGQGMLTMACRTMLAKWFDRRRGLASSISSIFVNFGFASAPLLFSLWIASSGWRGAWLEMSAIVFFGMGGIGWLFFRDSPERCGLRMDGAAPPPANESDALESSERDFTRAEALRTLSFWAVTLAVANQAMVGTGITFHIVDIGGLAGRSEAEAVSIFLPIAVVSVVVGLIAGWAIDRFALRYLVVTMLAGQSVAYFFMPDFGDPLARALVIGGWGVGSGFFGPLTVAALPRYFGRRHLGAISSIQMMVMVMGSAIGPALLAIFRQELGDYRLGLHLSALAPVAIALLAMVAKDPQRRG